MLKLNILNSHEINKLSKPINKTLGTKCEQHRTMLKGSDRANAIQLRYTPDYKLVMIL